MNPHIKQNFELEDYSNQLYKMKKAPGDGDCAYHAFLKSVHILYPDVKIPNNTRSLRQLLINTLKDTDMLINGKKYNNTVKNRIQSGIDNLGTGWAENDEFEILAVLFDVCIAVWSQVQNVWIYFIHKDISTKFHATQGCDKIIYLYNSGVLNIRNTNSELNVYTSSNQSSGIHYDYLIPVANTDVESEDTDVESEDTDVESEDTDVESEDTDVESEDTKDTESEDTDVESEDTKDTESEDTDADEGKQFSIYTNWENIDDKLTKKEKSELDSIEKATLKKKFEYFKAIHESFKKNKNFTDVQKIMYKSKLLKPKYNEHRLDEHNEYFVDVVTKYPLDGFAFTNNQKFLKKFLSMDTSNTSILLFHGVGVGKTCSSILIAENFVDVFDKKVLVLLPSALENNYRKELFDMSKLNYETRTYESCNGQQYLDLIPGWNKMSRVEVNKKIQKMINEKYSFFGYLKMVNYIDNITRKSKEKYGKDRNKRSLYIFNTVREEFSNRIFIIDEIHNIRLINEKSMKKFPKVLKFILRCAENVRLVMLSATPMFDNPNEISWLMDFVYLTDKQYYSYDTRIEFDDKERLTKSSMKRLKYFAQNYVSYMRGYDPETFPIQYFSSSKLSKHPKLDMLDSKSKITPIDDKEYEFMYSKMKGQQEHIYNINKIKKNDTNKDIQNRIQLSNIVYPTDNKNDIRNSKGKTGFFNNFNKRENKKLLEVIYNDKKNQFLKLENLNDYSSKLFNILKDIDKKEGLILIYSKYLYSGLIPCAIALEHLGYDKYNNNNILLDNKTKKNKLSYIILTADDTLSPNNTNELLKFNDPSNQNGDTIKIALINEVASEGVTFKNVREIHILEPWYNMNKIEQIIGRGVRYYSHHTLCEAKRNVGVYLHLNMDDDNIETVDYRRYRLGIKKQDKINQIENIIKSNSIDCVLNNRSSINLNKEIVKSDGSKVKILSKYDNIVCAHKSKMVKEPKYSNLRMLLFDIIETSKHIKKIIANNLMYEFDLEQMKEMYDNDLLENTLSYMCKNKTIVCMNNIKGYLIKTDNKYLFQQEEIDDYKITLVDRKKKKRKYISNYVINEENNEETEDIDNTQTKVENNINSKFLKAYNKLQQIIQKVDENSDNDIIANMIVDRISENDIEKIVQVTNPLMLKSLVRGKYVIKDETDDEIVAYYNAYMDTYLCKNKKDKFMKCDISTNNKYEALVKKDLTVKSFEGFIDIITNKDKTKFEPKSKVKHMDKNIQTKSFGTACLTTSSITLKLLKEAITKLNSKINLDKQSKSRLCLIYEYYLRLEDRFLRTIEYNIKKKLI